MPAGAAWNCRATVAGTLLAAFWAIIQPRVGVAYYILRGSMGGAPAVASAEYFPYAEAPIRLTRRSAADFVDEDAAADAQPPKLILLGASDFVPSLTPIDRVESTPTEPEEGEDGEPAAYLLIPQRADALDGAARAKRAVADAQNEAFATILEEAAAQERAREDAELLADAQNEEQLADELEYMSRAEQLRQALLERRQTPVAIAVVDGDDAQLSSDRTSLSRIFLPSASDRVKRVADGDEAVRLPVDDGSDDDDGEEGAGDDEDDLVYRRELEDPPKTVFVQRLADADDADDDRFVPFVIVP